MHHQIKIHQNITFPKHQTSAKNLFSNENHRKDTFKNVVSFFTVGIKQIICENVNLTVEMAENVF